MNKLERLEQEAFDKKVKVHRYYLGEPDLKGIYINGNIALNTSLGTSAERTCVLAEEIGHHDTTVGDIIDLSKVENRKQEHKSRLQGYNKVIGLRGIIEVFEKGYHSLNEAADHLEVTEDYLQECISCYRNKYGVMTIVDNYCIIFIPHLVVGKLWDDVTPESLTYMWC